MSDVGEALNAALQSLVGMTCSRCLATNSIKLSFDFQDNSRGRAYVWIDPPWQLTFRGAFVTGSNDWPQWDGKEDRETNEPLWRAWCAHFEVLDATKASAFSVADGCPDLCVHFESGHAIETFGNSVSDYYWWYYRDRITGEVFEASSNGIRHEFGEPAVL